MVEQLGALGEVIPDRTLALHVIRSLNERFKNVGMHLRRGRPFPTFLEAKADLLLEEMTMDPQAPSQATALAASGSTPTAPSQSVRPGGTDSGGVGGLCSFIQQSPQQAQRQARWLRTAVAAAARRAAL